MRIDASKAVGAYAAVMTLATVWLGLTAVSAPATKFETIDVQRINVREPDGTLRMTISGKARIPGLILGGVEHPHPNRQEAGMIFFNDQGDENGGLVFDGGMKNGVPTNGGSLTFDRYHQDQTLQMVSTEEGKARRVGVIVTDRPDRLMDVAAGRRLRDMAPGPERARLLAEAGFESARRIWLGRDATGEASLVLSDAEGRPRLTLGVGADGTPGVRLLDPAGNVTREIK
ncbi:MULTISPECIES: hypothetical protein [Novosphingobium]|uniref:hypothetical protein n=1 Tax=Novosphingobium TaxID=165696 RepID=UPI0022F24A0D|nr:hypothetical protein [Novosphingobium resinovorum]GLK42333.1 hypothetical protein GCM10017612_02500 [Novosphingobium resinovorum]